MKCIEKWKIIQLYLQHLTAFNRKLLRDLEELRNLLVRNKPERVMKKLNELIEDTKRDITE